MKKQSVSLLLLAFTASFILFSCGNGKQKIYGGMEFDSVSVNETAHLLDNDTASPSCNLTIKYTYPIKAVQPGVTDSINNAIILTCFGEGYKNMTVTEAVDNYKNDYIKDYRTDLISLYEEDKKNNPKGAEVSAWYSYYNNIEAQPLADNPKVLVYYINTNSYTGGAHGIYSIDYLNFNPENGHLITLNDVFNEGCKNKLNEMLLAQFMKDQGVATLEQLQEKAYLQDTDMYPSENFRLGKDSITFFYNVYEIAPYSSGTTEITLSYDELKDILKENK